MNEFIIPAPRQKIKEVFEMSEIYLNLCRVRALVGCLDDAITNTVSGSPSEAGERAICLVDLLVEQVDAMAHMMEDQGRGAA